MMSEYKLFTLRTGLVGITNLLLGLSDIILLPILTKNLPIEEYGIWIIIIVTINLIPQVVLLGLPYSMVRFLAAAKKREEMQEGFYSILFMGSLVTATTSLLFLLFSKIIATNLFNSESNVVWILAPIIFINCLNTILHNFFRTFHQIKKHSLFSLLRAILRIALVGYFVLSGYGIFGALYGLFFSKLIIFLIMFTFVIKKIGFKFPIFLHIKEYLNFGIPTISSSLSNWIIRSSDRYIIGVLLGTAFVGYYSPGYALSNRLISLFLAPLSFILPTTLSKYYDNRQNKEVKTLLRYSLKYFLVLAIPSVFGLSLLSKPILRIISTAEIASQGYFITPFVAISTLVFGIYSILVQIIVLEKKTKVMSMIWAIAAIINLGSNIILIRYIGILGAAVATFLASVIVLILTLKYSIVYFRLDIDLSFLFKSIIASTIISLLIILWKPIDISSIFIVIGICAIIYFVILLLLKGFKNEEIHFFKDLFKI